MKARLLLNLILFSFSSTLFSQVTFSTTDISEVKSLADTSHLPYFVYIYGDWCLPCQVMEETTFKSLDLQNAIDAKYTAYKVDFHSQAGEAWVAAYDVCCLPTFLFFDEHGNKTQQIQSSLTASGFIEVLKKPESYSKENEVFANANSSDRLQSQVFTQSETLLYNKANLSADTGAGTAQLETNITKETNNLSNANSSDWSANQTFTQKEIIVENISLTASTDTSGYSSSQENNSLSEGMENPPNANSLSTSSNAYSTLNNSSPYSNTKTIETTGLENKKEFLNDLRKHISSLEMVYAKYEVKEDKSQKINPVSPLAKMEGFTSNNDSKSDCECEDLAKNALELGETIKELKILEAQLETLYTASSTNSAPVHPKINVNSTIKQAVSSPSFVYNTSEEQVYYNVQMGMFKTEAYARRMVEDLANSYTYSIEMKTIEKVNKTLYRVLLGPFSEESEAKEAYSIMRRDGRKAVVGIF